MKSRDQVVVILPIATLVLLQASAAFASANCPNGYSRLGQTCYKIGHCANWQNAQSTCEADGHGFLYKAEQENFDQMRYHLQAIRPTCEEGFWIGARRYLPSTTFQWRDGSILPYYSSFWAPGQPDPPENAQCVEMRTASSFNGKLNDHMCNVEKDYVCQACPSVENCKKTSCSPPSQTKCTECVDNNNFYKITNSGWTCDRMCAWNNHYCWPGHCNGELTKNCVCSVGFDKVSTPIETSCQPRAKPSIETCDIVAIGPNGEKKRAETNGPTSDCHYKTDFYGNYLPKIFHYTHYSSFNVNITNQPTKPSWIESFNFGVTDARLEIVLRDLRGSETRLTTSALLVDTSYSQNAKGTFPSEGNVTLPNVNLTNGDSICVKHVVQGGGFLKPTDISKSTHMSLQAKAYRKTTTSKTICFRLDSEAPKHCLETHSCNTEPLELQARITRTPNITVRFGGWFDPIPVNGNLAHTSKIESYEIRVTEVSGTVKLQAGMTSVFKKTVNATENQMTLNIGSAEPRLYCVTLEVKDVAGNVRQARRFFLFDNATNITSRSDKPFTVISASKSTNYMWQTHHNAICLNWRNHFYNKFYFQNKLLNKIEADVHGLISGIYEQNTGLIPVNGTENVDGITQFFFAFSHNFSSFSPDIEVPNLLSQSYCKSFSLKDGDAYKFKISAIDVVNNTYSETRLVHIDRSVPEIHSIWLVRNGQKQIFVHSQNDLSKMELQFDAYDPHSGIKNVEWYFGLEDTNKDVLMDEAIGVVKLMNCSQIDNCYCPMIGGQCETFRYSIPLNHLINRNKHIGDHNRNYFFAIKVTNNADLFNIEHMDVLVDESPPQTGVVLEGSLNGPDIDFTSADSFLVHWHGFIDHESGIRLYKVGLAEKCLTIKDFKEENQTAKDWLFYEIEASENTIRLPANFTGKKYVSVIALNNALEPSEPACSDGITKDLSQPVFHNISLANAKWAESIYCSENGTFLLRSDLVKVDISESHVCNFDCNITRNEPFLESLPQEKKKQNKPANETEVQEAMLVSDFLCSNLPRYKESTIIYVPNDHIYLSWEVLEDLSQIQDFYVGIGKVASESNAPSLLNYVTTGRKYVFKIHHAGIGTNTEFFIFLKGVNKAGIETVINIGPVLIDQTPPRYKKIPIAKIDGDSLVIGWENDTFYDDEQLNPITQIMFEIGHDTTKVTPLLEWRKDFSSTCKEFSGGCFTYPLKRLQRHDNHVGLNFYATLHVYNNAGHFITLRTPEFKLPSVYPPGHAVINDLDPDDTIKLPQYESKDVQAHCTPHTLCVSWTGFEHHEKLTLEIAAGSNNSDDNIRAFSKVNDTGFHCISSQIIPMQTKVFVSLRATCSGGTTISRTDGVTIYNRTEFVNSFNVFLGPKCFSDRNLLLHQVKAKIIEHVNESLFLNHTLRTGRAYTLRLIGSDNSIRKLRIASAPVIILDTTTADKYIDLVFQTTSDLNKFSITTTNNKRVFLERVELYDCKEKSMLEHRTDEIDVHWSRLPQNFVYKYSLVSVQCPDTLNDTCIQFITQFERTLEDSVTLKGLNLRRHVNYSIIVKPCLNERCLSAKGTEIFQINPPETSLKILNSEIHVDKANCINVIINWQVIAINQQITFYKWAIFSRTSNSTLGQILTSWQTVLSTTSVAQPIQVDECINISSKHALKTLFACVRAFNRDGQRAQLCQRMTVSKMFQPYTVYDFNANSEMWDKIKEVLHSFYLGDRLTELHDQEIDFATADAEIAGAVLHGDSRNITWFLMLDRSVPLACRDPSLCVYTSVTTTGFAIFPTRLISRNTVHYICAFAKEAEVTRETSKEILPELSLCSDGFFLDTIPPHGGSVIVEKNSGYMNDLKDVAVFWKDFKDNVKAGTLDHYNPIHSYTVCLGTRPFGKDINTYELLGEENGIHISDLSLKDGTNVYFTVISKDQAGLNGSVTSNVIVVDTSAPTVGRIVQEDAVHTNFVSSNTIRTRLYGFEDLESGIDYFVAYIGSSEYTDDVVPPTKFYTDMLELVLNSDVIDGHHYFLCVKAINRAALASKCAVMNFIIDRSPPTGGHVLDGLTNNQVDLDFQTDMNFISAHWYGFVDSHSGIHRYRAGLGTKPFLDDIVPMTSTGLKTSIIWNSTFNAGQKYFVTVEACNGAFLCRTLCSDGLILDQTPPIQGLVRVGSLSQHQTFIAKNSTVEIFWTGFEDPESGIDRFEACIGTTKGLCDIAPVFNCLLASSHIKTGLDMPENTDLFVTVKAFNKNNISVSKSSNRFLVDLTPPKIFRKPTFYSKYVSHRNSSFQWENSVLRISWKFVDDESPVLRHVITLITNHDGLTPVEHIELGSEDKLTITLDAKHRLQDGDVYRAQVTACNAAGLCNTATSDSLLIDSTPPHLGGFKPPLSWESVSDSNGTMTSSVNLSWYGFHDQESGIKCFYIGIGTTYSGNELSNGLITVNANSNSKNYSASFRLNNDIMSDDKIVVSITAKNNAGLMSSISILTLRALAATSTGNIQTSKGLLEIEKHSCDVHFCNKDCTCAVVGEPCIRTQTKMTCTQLDPTTNNLANVSVRVLTGLSGEPTSITASSACLAAHWIVEHGESTIKRFEWSMGIKDGNPGENIFDKTEIPWKDIGKFKQVVYCLQGNKSLINREKYTAYVRAWISTDKYIVFQSSPVTVDTTAPAVTKGKYINDSDSACAEDYDVIDWNDTVTACWNNVFNEQQGEIIYYQIALGTRPGGDDTVSKTNAGLNTTFTARGLSLTPGQRYFFSVTAFNDVGLYHTEVSDGFLVDTDQPLPGVVYNTKKHNSHTFQSSSSTFELSWHGFLDHESGIKAYSAAVVDFENKTLVANFVDCGIETSVEFTNLSLEQGRKYIGAVKAIDAMEHESDIVFSDAKTIDTTPPCVFSCRDKTVVNESVPSIGLSSMNVTVGFEINAVYFVYGKIRMNKTYPHVRITVDENREDSLPLQLNHDNFYSFHYRILSDFNGNHVIHIAAEDSSAVIDDVSVSKCEILLREHSLDALRVVQVSPHTIKASINVIDPESYIKRVWVGAGTTPGGLQHKSFYQIDKWSDEYMPISSAHGTPVYVMAIVENYAGLRSTFYSKKLNIDHTPPIIEEINATVQAVHDINNSTYNSEAKLQVKVTWKASDPESHIKMCFISVGSHSDAGNMQGKELARHGNIFVSKMINVVHGQTLYSKIQCINNIELETIRISEGIIVSLESPRIQQAIVQFISTSTLYRGFEFDSGVDVQSDKSRLLFYWTGFEDESGIEYYEYRLASIAHDWTAVGKRTTVSLDGLNLADGNVYTVEIRAVNSGHHRSDSVNASILVDSRPPKLTGKPIEMNVTDGSVILNWKDVFEITPNIPAFFDVTIGSSAGAVNIADKRSVQDLDGTFQIPKSNLESEREYFVSLRCWKISGPEATYRFTYKTW